MHQLKDRDCQNRSKNKTQPYVRQKLIKQQGKIDESTIIVRDFNIPLSEMDRSRRPEIRKEIVEFNNTFNQLDLIDIYRLLQQH